MLDEPRAVLLYAMTKPTTVHISRTPMRSATTRIIWHRHRHNCQTPAMSRRRSAGDGEREGWGSIALPGNVEK